MKAKMIKIYEENKEYFFMTLELAKISQERLKIQYA